MKLKNYILLSVFYIFTILLVVYLCVIYKNSSNVGNSFISNYVVDVTGKNYDILFSNVSNYNMENHQFIIYVSSYKDKSLSSVENVFEEVINDRNLKGKILYINVDNLKSFDYVNRLLSDFGYTDKVKKSSLPIFIVVNDEKIVDVKSVSDFNKEKIESIVKDIYD